MRTRKSRLNEGFTLIEMMVVVAIVGVLGFVAINSYRKHLDNSRKVEVAGMFAEIRTREEAYRAEFSTYLTAGANEDDVWPVLAATGEPLAKDWAGAPASWAALGLSPGKSQLYCGYSIMSGAAGAAPAGARGATVYPAPPTAPWWYASGTCDNDGDSTVNVMYVTSSDSQTISEQNEHR